jgi:hypothetical protein
MVEFAILLPVIIFLTLGLADVARVIYYYNVVSNAAREGAREAVLSYNRCSNQVVGPVAADPSCQTPPAQASLVGVEKAVNGGAGGIMKFDFTNAELNTHTGTPQSCTPADNSGCVYVFINGAGTGCTDASGTPDRGPGPTDEYSLCDFDQDKATGSHDVVVEIQYKFLPFTPLVKDFLTVSYWAKSEMRTEY